MELWSVDEVLQLMEELAMDYEVTKAAQVCHEANRAYCATIGDDSQPAWWDAPPWQRESAIEGVKHAWARPEAKPSDSHESWVAGKLAAGWKYGPVKDAEKKEHPCLVPYELLPEEQRRKDALFLAVARALQPVPKPAGVPTVKAEPVSATDLDVWSSDLLSPSGGPVMSPHQHKE